MTPTPTVIYLMGLPYSGTTLLALLLGKSPDIFNAGELSFAENDYHPAKSCSCGELIDQCEAWGPTIGGAREMDARGERSLIFTIEQKLRVIDARWISSWKKVLKTVNAPPELIFGREEVVDYAKRHEAFIKIIAQETGASYVLDASKSITRWKALNAHTDLQMIVVYVKRSIFESYAARIKRAKRRDQSYSVVKAPLFLLAILIRVWLFNRIISNNSSEGFVVVDYTSLVDDPAKCERDLSAQLGTNVNFGLRDRMFSKQDVHVWTGNIWLTRNASEVEEVELRHSDSISALTQGEKSIFRFFAKVASWLGLRLK